MNHPHIKYRGYFTGNGDWAGTTGLHDTAEEALAAANGNCHRPTDTAEACPEYTGPLDALFLAVVAIPYTDRRGGGSVSRQITGGTCFRPAEILEADRYATRGGIARMILGGMIRPVEAV